MGMKEKKQKIREARKVGNGDGEISNAKRMEVVDVKRG